MPFDSPSQRLREIIENILAIRDFVRGMDEGEFTANREKIYAVTRALEIISEASRRLPDDLKKRHPAVDWRAIAAAGNIYRHEYHRLLAHRIWLTATEGLGQLESVVLQELQHPTGEPTME